MQVFGIHPLCHASCSHDAFRGDSLAPTRAMHTGWQGHERKTPTSDQEVATEHDNQTGDSQDRRKRRPRT